MAHKNMSITSQSQCDQMQMITFQYLATHTNENFHGQGDISGGLGQEPWWSSEWLWEETHVLEVVSSNPGTRSFIKKYFRCVKLLGRWPISFSSLIAHVVVVDAVVVEDVVVVRARVGLSVCSGGLDVFVKIGRSRPLFAFLINNFYNKLM